jgi:hypothetical protein
VTNACHMSSPVSLKRNWKRLMWQHDLFSVTRHISPERKSQLPKHMCHVHKILTRHEAEASLSKSTRKSILCHFTPSNLEAFLFCRKINHWKHLPQHVNLIEWLMPQHHKHFTHFILQQNSVLLTLNRRCKNM